MLRPAFAVLSLIVVSGCTVASGSHQIEEGISSITRTGYTAVLPTSGLRVGRIYFSGEGKRPAFVTTGGTVFNDLCYDDFRQTKALKDIGEHIIDDGVSTSKATVTAGLSGSAGVGFGLSRMGDLTLSGEARNTRQYVVENVRTVSLTDRGSQIIRDSISDRCKREIETLRAASRQVVLVLSAQRADKVTDTTNQRLGGAGGVTVGGQISQNDGVVSLSGRGGALGARRSSDRVTEYHLVYLSVRPEGI